MNTLQTVEQYAAARGVGVRQVRRYLSDGRLPDAVKLAGTWSIPAGSVPLPAPMSGDVTVTSPRDVTIPERHVTSRDVQVAERWVPVAEYAAAVGSSEHQVRRALRDGLIRGGNYGRDGATIVVVGR